MTSFAHSPGGSRRALVAASALLILIADLAVAAARSQPPSTLPSAVDVEVPGPVLDEVAVAARHAAGCELVVDSAPQEDRRHLDVHDAPPPEALYPSRRPADSGRHYGSLLAVPTTVTTEPIDERAVVHNMEHGSVVVWFDAGQVGADEVDQIGRWLRERLALGFVSEARGAVFASPAPVITSGRAIALRAWGVALDCDRFDVTVADRFLQDHWGSHGASPEAHLSPFPIGVFGEVGDFH